jgi:hypothetical protein
VDNQADRYTTTHYLNGWPPDAKIGHPPREIPLLMCNECGAAVTLTGIDVHDAWHTRTRQD